MNETWTLPSHSNQFIKNCVASLFTHWIPISLLPTSRVLCVLSHLQFIRQFPVLSLTHRVHKTKRGTHEAEKNVNIWWWISENVSETIEHVVKRSGGRWTLSFTLDVVYIYILNINKLWMQSDDNKSFFTGVKKQLPLFWLRALALNFFCCDQLFRV